MVKWLSFSVLLLSLPFISDVPVKTHPVIIPTQVVENRFYAHPVTKDGIELNFYTDSAGGLFMFRSVVDRLHLPTTKRKIEDEESEEAGFPDFQPGKGLPSPLGHDNKLFVRPKDKNFIDHVGQDVSGMLGQQWFAGRVWTWDYPRCKLLWRAEGDLPKVATAHRIRLGFLTNDQGKRFLNTNFGR